MHEDPPILAKLKNYFLYDIDNSIIGDFTPIFFLDRCGIVTFCFMQKYMLLVI